MTKIAGVFKCRNCGAILTDEPRDMSVTTRWLLEQMFKDGESYIRVEGCGTTDFGGRNLLHKCAPERLCICDFIGWEMKKDG